MTQEERTKICSTCKNRSFSIKEGLLCKKTMEKPSFEDSCSDYEVDAVEVSKQEQFNKELKESNGISGFLSFYVYWSIPLGILFTIIAFFATPKSLQFYAYSLCLFLFDVVYLAIYLYLAIYTIYAFVKQKPDAVFMGKCCLAFIFVSNFLLIITGATGNGFLDNLSRLLSSSIWCIVFFLYLSFSQKVKDYIPKETRRVSKLNKVIVTLSIVLPILLLFCAIVEIAACGGEHGLLIW